MRTTVLARRIMKAAGRDVIFTNKYEHCHTVKCYAHKRDGLAMRTLLQILTMALKGRATVKVHNNNNGYSNDSIIVRVPNEKVKPTPYQIPLFV